MYDPLDDPLTYISVGVKDSTQRYETVENSHRLNHMTSIEAAQPSYPGVTLRRGSPQRKTNWEEEFQSGIMRSIAAAAGCEFCAPHVDDGIDCELKRRFDGVVDAEIEIQLKAVSNPNRWNAQKTHIATTLSKKRYNAARIPLSEQPVVRRIIVIMDLPSAIDDWISCQQDAILMNNACYWVSLEGRPELQQNVQTVTVKAPANQVFNDTALCAIMEKIHKGQRL